MALGKTLREFGVKLSLAWDKSSFTRAEAGISDISSQMRNMGFAAAAAAGTIFGFAEATASNAKELEIQATSLGMNVEAIQELAFAAKVGANVNREELVGSLESVNKSLLDFKAGNNDAVEGFRNLGIQAGELNSENITTEQLFGKVLDHLQNIPNQARRSAIAVQLLGSAGARLATLGGSKGLETYAKQARSLGVIVDDKTNHRWAEFQKRINVIVIQLQNLAYVLGGKLMPHITKIVDKVQKWVQANKEWLASGIAEGMNDFVDALRDVFDWLHSNQSEIKGFIKALGGVSGILKIIAGSFLVIQGIKLGANIATIVTALLPLMPFIGTLALIAAAAVGVHDLWVMITTGSYEDTWIYRMIKDVGEFLDNIPTLHKFFGKVKEVGSSAVTAIKNHLPDTSHVGMGVYAMPGVPNGYKSPNAAGSAPAKNVNMTLNQNTTIQTAPGTTTDQSEQIARAHEAHTGKMLRETINRASGGVE